MPNCSWTCPVAWRIGSRPASLTWLLSRPSNTSVLAVIPLSLASPSPRDAPVLSVPLFSRKPWDRDAAAWRAWTPDRGPAAALTQILLRKRYGVHPEIMPLLLDQDADDVDADAVLLIGDRAMRACLPGFVHAYDLGQEWYDWTGLPFVYAVWAVRPGIDLAGVDAALIEAKKRGVARAGLIAHEEAPRLGLDAGFCRRYLANILHFDLGPREQAGLRHYYALACELGGVLPGEGEP